MAKTKSDYAIAIMRILIGLVVLWAFADKLLGLGFATCRTDNSVTGESSIEIQCDKAWVKGGSPTEGFLKFGTRGPLAEIYQGLAGNAFVDTLFMVGLLGISLALILGIGIKIAVFSGALLFMMMWSAALPPENNPVLDNHIIYIAALFVILFNNSTQVLGLGSKWNKQELVKKYPVLI
jgi:thiosulfate dehydrogenase [quinone] large subunit